MKIIEYYKYEKDGVIGVSTEVPEGADILETMDILTAEDGYELVRISNNENVGPSIWLHDGDVQENYKEVEREERPFEPDAFDTKE